MARIPIVPDEPNGGGGGQGPCAGEGYKPRSAKEEYRPGGGTPKWIQLEPCRSGFSPKKDADGRPWCCKDSGELPDPGDERPPNCAGGQKRELGDPCPEELPKKVFYKKVRWCCPETEEEEEEDGTEDCPLGNWYTHFPEKGPCHELYTFIRRGTKNWEGYEPGADGRCECTSWLKKYQDGDGDGEQWAPSEGLQAIIDRLLARIDELLGYETGLSEEELQMIINRMSSNIKEGERGRIESMEGRLGGMGLLGSGMELAEYGKIKRGTREVGADVEAQVAIDQALRKYEQYMGTTGMAQSLFGTTLGVEQLTEILNSARRGEGRQDTDMMLKLLQIIMGNQGNDPYWQAILNQAGSRQRTDGGGGMDWMYWLPFLL